MRIDLNADLGEGFGPWAMGDDAAMLDLVTSANIACGGHAGDPEVMFATAQAAVRRGVTVGAHPGYADPMGFGRRVIPMTPSEIGRMVAAQVGALMGVARLAGAEVGYVKPHGALANLAADDRAVGGQRGQSDRRVDGVKLRGAESVRPRKTPRRIDDLLKPVGLGIGVRIEKSEEFSARR